MIDKKHQNKPRICLFDIQENIIQDLKELNFDCFSGSLGSKMNLGYIDNHAGYYCLLNSVIPQNLHEYDIFIVDLDKYDTIAFDQSEYKTKKITGSKFYLFNVKNPTTIFDPRPITSDKIGKDIQTISSHPILIILFTTADYQIDYRIGYFNNHDFTYDGNYNYSIYSMIPWLRTTKSIYGKEISILKETNYTNLLNRFSQNIEYNQAFYATSNTAPLIKNLENDCVSLFAEINNKNYLILPQYKDKKDIIISLFTEVCPDLFPSIFPNYSKYSWLTNSEYYLPNHKNLLIRKNDIIKDFDAKIFECDKEIEENAINFGFLKDLLIETGQPLVNSIIEFFKWLDYKEVIDVDSMKTTSDIKEEDIQIKLDNGLIVIEVKGIGNLPTDSDCSQITKIRYRRCEVIGNFNVHGIFIVNHQRYIPPLKRTNPPFDETKIKDAVNDKRGLISTWQLFNLYFDISNNTITKDEARNKLLNIGLIEFIPDNIDFLFKPVEIYKNGTVFIITLHSKSLKVGDYLCVEKNGRYEKVKILSLQLNNNDVDEINDGEIGVLIDSRIEKNSTVYSYKQKI